MFKWKYFQEPSLGLIGTSKDKTRSHKVNLRVYFFDQLGLPV